MNNKNYRVMKFFEPVNKKDNSRGYVRLDIRGIKGNIIVSVDNLGDVKTTSEVYLYKDRTNKIKLGDINNKKGMLKKLLTFGSNSAIEDYNICAVVKDKKIVMYSNLFKAASLEQIRKLEIDEDELTKKTLELESTSTSQNSPEQTDTSIEKTNEEPVQEEKETFKEVEIFKEVEKNKALEKIKEVEKIKENEDKEINVADEQIKDEDEEEIADVTEDDRIKRTSVPSAVDIKDEPIAQSSTESEEDVQAQAHKRRNKFDQSLYNVLKDYKEVEPLSVRIKNLNWWYIPYDETGVKNGFLPYYNQIISSYYPYPMSNRVTTCNSLMKKYGHYIFGVYKDKGDIVKFVYGVPGEFTKEEQPYKGITGFKNWSYSNKESKDKHGYWLAFVNPRTGETAEPPKIVLN